MTSNLLRIFGKEVQDDRSGMHVSTKWLIAEIAFLVIIAAIMSIYNYPLLFSYPWHRALHILGGVIFLGNIIVTGVWMLMIERTREQSVMRFGVRMVNWADVFFTAPGVILVLLTGEVLATRWGGFMRESWITAGLGLFILSGVAWIGFLVRYQHALIRISASFGDSGGPSKDFFRVLHKWYFWGVIATISPLLSLILMVIKPELW